MRHRTRRTWPGCDGVALPGIRARPSFGKSVCLTDASRGLWLVSVACPNRFSAPASSAGLSLMRRRSFRSNGGRADISKRRASVVHAAASGRQPSGVALRAVPRPADGHKPVRAGPDARQRAKGLHGPENRVHVHSRSGRSAHRAGGVSGTARRGNISAPLLKRYRVAHH